MLVELEGIEPPTFSFFKGNALSLSYSPITHTKHCCHRTKPQAGNRDFQNPKVKEEVGPQQYIGTQTTHTFARF